MATEITVPQLGESVTEGTIAEWLKQPGDAVAVDEPIVSLETDKVAVEVPSPVAGVIEELRADVGDTVEVGAVLATVAEGAAPAAKGKEANRDQGEGGKKGAEPAKAKDADAGQAAYGNHDEGTGEGSQTLSPAVRRAVLEYGVDPSSIKGSGKDGRLTKEDVIAAAKNKDDSASSAPTPSAAPATVSSGERREERVKM
ncbi:MAG: dihydrolipoamide succinyltransferase, partial [Citromicrobium sp.]|nr:dihydrolipoamide succinyltransferase [Citromicrobium sp.]